MSRELTLARLTTELRDFLELPENLDLPKVSTVECEFNTASPGWRCQARIAHTRNCDALYESLVAWAACVGGTIEASKPYPSTSSVWPSGTQRNLSLRVVVAEVAIQVYALVDGAFEIPQTVEAVTAR